MNLRVRKSKGRIQPADTIKTSGCRKIGNRHGIADLRFGDRERRAVLAPDSTWAYSGPFNCIAASPPNIWRSKRPLAREGANPNRLADGAPSSRHGKKDIQGETTA